jgi:hypothetical protein
LQWDGPLDLQDHRVRRLFARDFVAELRRIGAASTEELHRATLSLLKVPASEAEIAQVAEAARRLDWVESRERRTEGGGTTCEWGLTEAGSAVPPPESLILSQVVARVLRFADPVRKSAVDWLPLAAVVVGAVAASREAGAGDGDQTSLIAIRIISIAVLFYALVRGAIGEVDFVRASRAFPRIQQGGLYAPIKAFYSWSRLWWVFTFDLAVLTAFGLAIFLSPWAVVPATVALVVYLFVEVRWRTPARRCVRKRQARPTTS